jgi:hypothetical protein
MRKSEEWHTADSIDLLLGQLVGIVESIRTSKATLQLAKKESVFTKMADARETGMKKLQGFADALRDATHDVAMKALQEHAVDSLSDLSDVPKNGAIQRDSSEQKPTKNKASDKGKPDAKAK